MADRTQTYKIIGTAMFVHGELGRGYLERTYHDILERELLLRGIPCRREVAIDIWWRGERVGGTYRADLLCYEDIIVELKALPQLGKAERAQLGHYLTATGKPVGILLNFGAQSLEFQRVFPRRSAFLGPRWADSLELRDGAEPYAGSEFPVPGPSLESQEPQGTARH